MGYKLGYHILVLPNQVLLINSVLTDEVLLYKRLGSITVCVRSNEHEVVLSQKSNPNFLRSDKMPKWLDNV